MKTELCDYLEIARKMPMGIPKTAIYNLVKEVERNQEEILHLTKLVSQTNATILRLQQELKLFTSTQRLAFPQSRRGSQSKGVPEREQPQ